MADAGIELLLGTALHQRVVEQAVLGADRWVWIATANLKDMHVPLARGRFQPILEAFDRMAARGVAFRVIHSDLPSRPFRATLERFPRLTQGAMELQICPRSHWKMIVVDGRRAYCGSANFTGAGLGAKAPGRRNLEVGIYTERPDLVRGLADAFDDFWRGNACRGCAFVRRCPDPIQPE